MAHLANRIHDEEAAAGRPLAFGAAEVLPVDKRVTEAGRRYQQVAVRWRLTAFGFLAALEMIVVKSGFDVAQAASLVRVAMRCASMFAAVSFTPKSSGTARVGLR